MKHNRYFIVLIALVFVTAISVILNKQQTMPMIAHIDNPPTIIVDAGHGDFDGGAIGYNNTIEKTLNLDIALKLRDILKAMGFNVIMTRTEDVSTCDDNLNTIREKKRSDILNRLDLINSNPDALFISIHQNSFPQAQYSGTQIFYSTNNAKSKPLAQMIQTTIKENLQPENDREIKPCDDSIYLLYHSNNPSVLVECGFISNPEECIMLKEEEYQVKIAFLIAISIKQHCEQDV